MSEDTGEKRLLIIEDNEDIRRQLGWGFSGEGYTVLQAANADEALALQQREKPQVVTLDLGLPPDAEGSTEGYRCLDELLARDPQVKVIVVTGHHSSDNAFQCVRNGAYDFFRKPTNLEELKVIVRRAFFLSGLHAGQQTEQKKEPGMHGIITQCKSMQAILSRLDKIALSDAPVLITGESGTGKELAAQAIHNMSERRNGRLVAINCGAIPEQLLESELFGHEKGAFTGAVQRVKGKVEDADQGTLFLDEIGELPLQLQVKLLRFLQEMIIQRVGGRKDIEVNVRIIAATNIDLPAAIKSGQFREDLYYRIGVVNVPLPPLRERGDDVILLAEHFIRRHDSKGQIKGLHESARKALRLYTWPGNVRELENIIRRAIIFTNGSLIKVDAIDFTDMAGEARAEVEEHKSLQEARNEIERKVVLDALRKSSGNIAKAALAIQVSRPTFYDLLRKHKIDLSESEIRP